MDFSDPFTGMERKKLTDAELAQAIRIDMAAELDAINLYQAHINATDNPVAKRMIQHIMDEEKDHLEEFAQILYMLDPRQVEAVASARQDIQEEAGGEPADICSPPSPEPATESIIPSRLTVGSLKNVDITR